MIIWKAFGEKTLNDFKKRLSSRIDLLALFPQMHKVSLVGKKYRQSVLDKNTSLIYSLDRDDVRIVRLINNKRNPDRFFSNDE